MKKILMILTVFSLVGSLFFACSDDDSRFKDDSQSGWVQFLNSASVNVLFKSGSTVSIPVALKAPVNTSGLEVNFSINDVVGSSGNFVSSTNRVVFDEASNTANLVLTLVGSSLPNTIEFDVVLTSTSRSNVSVGLLNNEVNIKPIIKRIKICSDVFTTNYVGASTPTSAGAPTYDGWVPTITPVSGTDNKYQFDTLWGSGLVPLLTGNPALNTFLYPGYLTINNDNTVTIEGINTPAAPNRYPGGTGTYDPCSKVIRYRLNQGLFTNTFQVDVVLIPN